MIAIIDYGVGNLFSLRSSLSYLGLDSKITGDPDEIRAADKIILPGVGAFGDAMQKLVDTGLVPLIREETRKKPLLGICLGMQLLFDAGYEYGCHKGLGLIPGEVRPISEVIPKGLKIPHMGWNALTFQKQSKLLQNVQDGDYVYFVHSYYAARCAEHTIATAEYGAMLTAAVEKDNIFGCQFHPEKSGKVGLEILRAFTEMKV